jgi:monomeric isocitrate dehydrogenase
VLGLLIQKQVEAMKNGDFYGSEKSITIATLLM